MEQITQDLALEGRQDLDECENESLEATRGLWAGVPWDW